MIRYPVAEPDVGAEEEKNVVDCIRSNWISSLGSYIASFESGFASRVERKHAVSTSSGTAALHLALLGLDIGPGDEVLVPALSFVACANTVLYVGAKPVFVDADPKHWNMDPQQAARKVTAKTKAMLVVHLYGHPAPMEPLLALAKEHGLRVIEDCAEAHGARYRGKVVGGFGDVSVFSFYGNKIMTTGEGGMLLFDEDALLAKTRLLRDHHMDPQRRYYHKALGYNYRMTNLQAAIGMAQLEKLSRLLTKKSTIASWYAKQLHKLEAFDLPPAEEWAKPVCWLYSPLLKENVVKRISREKFCDKLNKLGIDTRPFFVPLNQLPYMDADRNAAPVAEDLSKRGLNLPSSSKLLEADVNYIVDSIKKVLGP